MITMPPRRRLQDDQSVYSSLATPSFDTGRPADGHVPLQVSVDAPGAHVQGPQAPHLLPLQHGPGREGSVTRRHFLRVSQLQVGEDGANATFRHRDAVCTSHERAAAVSRRSRHRSGVRLLGPGLARLALLFERYCTVTGAMAGELAGAAVRGAPFEGHREDGDETTVLTQC